jgi:hypothetical protein
MLTVPETVASDVPWPLVAKTNVPPPHESEFSASAKSRVSTATGRMRQLYCQSRVAGTRKWSVTPGTVKLFPAAKIKAGTLKVVDLAKAFEGPQRALESSGKFRRLLEDLLEAEVNYIADGRRARRHLRDVLEIDIELELSIRRAIYCGAAFEYPCCVH